MTKPIRIQRKRTKGWRMPVFTSCVTRPGKWGNPFDTAEEFRSVMTLIDRGYVKEPRSPAWKRMVWIHANVRQLRGFNLACFCSLEVPCHADVLLEYANR